MKTKVLLVFEHQKNYFEFAEAGWIVADEYSPTKRVFRTKDDGAEIRAVTVATLEDAHKLAGHSFTAIICIDKTIPEDAQAYLRALVRGMPE